MNRRRSSATITSGGSSETELSAFTVMPCGWSPFSVVTTVTPVAKWPITLRKSSESGRMREVYGRDARAPRRLLAQKIRASAADSR